MAGLGYIAGQHPLNNVGNSNYPCGCTAQSRPAGGMATACVWAFHQYNQRLAQRRHLDRQTKRRS